MSNKMKFKVLRPVGLSGRQERGAEVELTLEDAQNIGGEYLECLDASVTLPKVEPAKAPASKAVDAMPNGYKPAEEVKAEAAPAADAPAAPADETAPAAPVVPSEAAPAADAEATA